MGTWGPALFSDDLALEVKGDFKDKIALALSKEAATQELLEEYQEVLDDPDEESVFWLALADTQWELGRPVDLVQRKALELLDSGTGLKRWEGSREYSKRKKVLQQLKLKLTTSPPVPKRIKKPYIQKTPFTKGSLVTYQLKKGTYCILKIVAIEEQSDGTTYPLIELLDYYSALKPTIDDLKKLAVKNIGEDYDDGRIRVVHSQQAFILATGKRDTAPLDRITILKEHVPTTIHKGASTTFFWKTFDEELIRLFEGNNGNPTNL